MIFRECRKTKFKKYICNLSYRKKFNSDIDDGENIMNCYDEKWVDKLIKKMTEIISNKPGKICY